MAELLNEFGNAGRRLGAVRRGEGWRTTARVSAEVVGDGVRLASYGGGPVLDWTGGRRIWPSSREKDLSAETLAVERAGRRMRCAT
ncbi:hypothetical protein [Pseudofrankia sp. BMG5.36]|uniref:hypothetical protein n=1 Tax=Pseudofrankia sp. BMG5.36 TaxID=1834512 RepID=UPI0008DAFC06|nr:hypothetical protein [Pseudofrankia sp. BMG5.36]OHV64821.1 hypothetical protein BCD48_36965 [Pseudofrankia sp. BMG5.36]